MDSIAEIFSALKVWIMDCDCGTKKAAEVAIRFAVGCYCLLGGCTLLYGESRRKLRDIAGSTLVGLGLAAFLLPPQRRLRG